MSADYSIYGWNTRLQGLSSIPERRGSITTAFDFGWQYQRSIINTSKLVNNVITTEKIVGSAVTDDKIITVSADKLTAGTITVGINLGVGTSGSMTFDGANNRIVINDGTTNRIVIGSV